LNLLPCRQIHVSALFENKQQDDDGKSDDYIENNSELQKILKDLYDEPVEDNGMKETNKS